jgi:alpha-aminoadipate carrier protein LysW
MARARQRRGEAVAYEGGIVGDDDGLVGHGLDCAIYQVLAIIRTSIDDVGACMATCPECDAEIEVDEFDVDKGDLLSCPDCGSNLEVTGTSPIELELSDDDDEDDDDDDAGDDEDFEDDDVDDVDEDDDSEKEDWDE